MAGCGYVCPVCEGSGKDDQGENCTWCTPHPNNSGLKEKESKGEEPVPELVSQTAVDQLDILTRQKNINRNT